MTDVPSTTTAVPASLEAVDDPMPVPPPQPDIDACCGNGCDPCIFDVYEQARQRYLEQLHAWRARQDGRQHREK